MEHLLFAGYLVLFAWAVTRIRFFTQSGLSSYQLIILFLLKVMAGMLYGWIGIFYADVMNMLDTWAFHKESLVEYQLLLRHPAEFFLSLFRSSYENGYGGFLGEENSWWNDLHGNFIIKMMALFNVLSLGNYYINVIFYSFLTIGGPIALYRVMKDVFPQQKFAVLCATFLIPSFLFWTSGMHKDGLLFLGQAVIIYHFYFGLKQARFGWRRLASILLAFVLILAVRNYVVVILLPALLAWLVAQKTSLRPARVFMGIYALFIFFFFTAHFLFPKLNLPNAVAEKQQQFLKLRGNSAVPTQDLKPTFTSFIANAPQALNLTVLRPYPSDVKHLLALAAAVETYLLLILFVVFLFLHVKLRPANPFLLFCLFFSFSILMTIGYTVHFIGAIVRYRSFVLPLLMVPVIAQLNWKKIGRHVLDINK